jgi:starch synthase
VLRVVHVAGELAGLAHSGGLGEVLAGLPRAQAAAGAQARVIIPGYRQAVAALGASASPGPVVHMPFGDAAFTRYDGAVAGVPVTLLGEPAWFDRPHLYGPPGGAYPDNPVRFCAFARAAAAVIAAESPELVHLHDWHAGLVAPLLLGLGPFRPRLVTTIHNLAYQGAFPADAFHLTGLPSAMAAHDGVLHWGAVNPLKAGIQHADLITTVSPSYAAEIQEDAHGFGLAPLLRWRAGALVGIVNGVATEGAPPDVEGRPARRRALAAELGLDGGEGALFAVVSRLTDQKGLDLFAAAIPEVLARGATAVVVGTGDADLVDRLGALTQAHPGSLRLRPRLRRRAGGPRLRGRGRRVRAQPLRALRHDAAPRYARGGAAAGARDGRPARHRRRRRGGRRRVRLPGGDGRRAEAGPGARGRLLRGCGRGPRRPGARASPARGLGGTGGALPGTLRAALCGADPGLILARSPWDTGDTDPVSDEDAMNVCVARLAALLLLLAPLTVQAAVPALDKAVRLQALGGVSVSGPSWEATRSDASVVVLERAPDPQKAVPFALLVVAIEEGPATVESVAWERIRDNIVSASKESGSQLTLQLGAEWGKAAGFKGRRLSGTLTANDREVTVEMVALVAQGVMVTVTAVAPKGDADAGDLVDQVAASTKRAVSP